MPSPRTLRPNVPFLSNYAVGLGQQPGIADEVAPILRVDTEIGVYNIFKGPEKFSDQYVDVRAPGAPLGEVDWSKSTAQYVAVERGLQHLVTDEEADVMGRQAADQAAIDLIRNLLDLGKERRIKTLLTTAGNHGTTKVASGAGGWDDAAADIIGDIRTVKRGVRILSGFEPNTIVIPDDVVPRIQKNTALIAGGAVVPFFTVDEQAASGLPARFFGMRVLTPYMIANTANLGQTAGLAQLWDGTDTVELLYVNNSPSILSPTWGLQFLVRTFGTNGVDVGSVRSQGGPGRFGDFVWMRRKQGEAVTFKEAGGIITAI